MKQNEFHKKQLKFTFQFLEAIVQKQYLELFGWMLIFIVLCSTYVQASDQRIQIVLNYLSTITPSTNVACSAYKNAFQSPTSGTTRQMNIVLNTNFGYSRLYYFFEFYNAAYLTPIQLTIKEGGEIIQTKILTSNNAINFCSEQCQHYYINLKSETGKNSLQEVFELHVNTSTNFWITNFQVYAQRCGENCKACSIQNCEICMGNFVLVSGFCQCTYPKYIEFNGQCQSECPTGFYNNFQTCKPMISSQTLLSNNVEPQLIPSYNSQTRSLKNSIDGVSFYGPIKFNEKIKYPLKLSFLTPQNIIFEVVLLFFNPQILQEIQIWLNEYLVKNIVLSPLEDLADYNHTSCQFTDIEKCQRLYLNIQFSNVTKIDNIQFFSNLKLGEKNSFWAVQDIKLQSIIPLPEICLQKVYNDNCISECPIWTNSDGNVCKDYTDIYPFYTIISSGFSNPLSIIDDKMIFSGFKDIENICCQYFQDKFLLGGYDIWQRETLFASYAISVNHYKLFLKFTLILIDAQNSEDGMLLNFGNMQKNITKDYTNSICSNSLGQVGCQTQEDLGKSDLDYIIEIQEEVLHNKQNLDLQFTCISKSGNSYCAIQNLLILSIDCPLNCLNCQSNTTCIEKENNNLAIYNLCPLEHYYSYLGQCQPCSKQCRTCKNYMNCLTCENKIFQLNEDQCYQTFNLVDTYSTFTQRTCHQTCSHCISQTYQNYNVACTCDIQENKVLNLNLCICIDGFYIDEYNSFECISCGPRCQTCKSLMFCLSCYSDQNRILDDNKCICKTGFYEFDNLQTTCLQCVSTCKTCINSFDLCTSCYTNQFRTISKQNTCDCQIGYYEDQNQNCQKCNQFCESCENSYQCLTCDINQFRTLLNKNCECQEGYFEDQNKQCLECYYTCSKCNNSNKYNQCTLCPSTRIKSSNFQDQFECKCKIGYYDDFYLNCLSCLDYIDPPSNHYCYSKCRDLIVQWDEECDDGNLESRDDCNQCYFPNSSCGNQYCLQCQFKQCIQCQDGYYLDSQNQCVQCSSSCIKCEKQKDNCTECKYLNQETNQCLLCFEEAGYKEINNQCLPVCGDGIKTKNENCDDGNIINGDGCNQYCQIEQGYQCNVECQKINYIQILLSESQQDQLYSSQRHISFTFNQLVKFQSQQKIKDLLQVTKYNSSKKQSLAIKNLDINDFTDYSKELLQVSLEIELDFEQSYKEPSIIVQLLDSNLFSNQDGFSVNQRSVKITLKDYLQQSELTVALTQHFINLNSYVLYFLMVLAIVAFLFGGLEIFWNLLDTLQLICYLKYFNVTYPYNLQEYFQLFSFAEFDFIKNQFNLQALIENYVESSDAPPKFHEEGYSTVFLVNIIAVITAFATTTFTFLIIKIMRYFLFKITNSFRDNKIINQNKINIITFYFYKFIAILQNQFQNIILGFKNTILRVFMTIAFDLNIAIFLQFKNIQKRNPFLFTNFLWSLRCFIFQLYIFKKGFQIVNNDKLILQQRNTQYKYGAFIEGINLHKRRFNYNYNLFCLIKKSIFAASLIFLYSVPYLQIGVASILNLCQGLFLLLNKPLEDSNEQIKQTIGEIIFWVVQLLILIFGFNEQDPFLSESSIEGIGWAIIGFLTLSILNQLIFDVKQHIIYLYSKYQILKVFTKVIIKIFKNDSYMSTDYTIVSDENLKMQENSSSFLNTRIQTGNIVAKRKMFHFQLQ